MEMLGKYRIEAKLGQGAMGYVYKAWHPGFHDYVALKTIQDTRLEGAQLLERFKREGQALAKLKHQNIVQIYDADQADGIHFIVMEYMNGGSLDRIIERRERSPLAKRVGCIVPACHALSYAHRRGLFHRDIKPANIMLHNDGNDEVVKVVDFGIARLVDLSQTQDLSISQTSVLIGSPAYMAPELMTGTERANERTDIWALGVTLFELICFERPFQGKNLDDLRRNVIQCKAKSLRQLAPECPSDLEAIVQRMIEKDGSSRYATVEDLLIDLEPIAKRMRSETAASLIHRASDLCEIGEMENAKSVLTEARMYDPGNTQLRELLQRVDHELQRRELLPRLHSHLKRARDFVRMEEFQNARQEIASALSLDASFEPARKYLEEIEDEVKKKESVLEKLRLIRLRIAEGELTQAEMFLKEIEEIDGGSTQSKELRREIEQEKQRRLKRKRINEIVGRAGVLMAALQEQECLVLLKQGLEEYPEEPELLRLQEIVSTEAAEALRQQERQRAIEEIRSLAGKGNFEAAQEKLHQLLQEFPGDAVVENAKSFVAEEIAKEKRRTTMRAEIEAVRSLPSRGQVEEADASLQVLMKDFPAELELRDLKDLVERELEKQRKKQGEADEQQTLEIDGRGRDGAIDAGIRTIRKKIRLRKYAEAVAAAEKLMQRFPAEAGVRDVHDEAATALEERKKQDLIQTRIREIRQKINKEQYEEAVGDATRTLQEFGPQQEIEVLLRAADVELKDQRARKETEQRKFLEAKTLLENGRKDEALELAQNAIATCTFKKNDPRVIGLMNDIRNWKGSGNERTPAPSGGNAPRIGALHTGSSQPSTRPNEKQIGVASDCRGAVQGNENDRPANGDAAAIEYTIKMSMTGTAGLASESATPASSVEPAPRKSRWIVYLAGAVAIGGIAFVIASQTGSEAAKRESAVFRQAAADEHEKRWVEAAAEYKTLAGGNGALASQAGREYTRLAALIDEEKDLQQQIEQAKAARRYDQAGILLTQLADLHGDMEAATVSEKIEVAQEARIAQAVPEEKHESPQTARAPRQDDKDRARKSAVVVPEVPAQQASGCELSASDLPVRLNRADRNSAQGDYASAEREYLAVLACQPGNEQARIGLERTRKAKNM
jgi:serine/threonine-protein kinase